jgi:DNA repair exonuclease SbcCD ATPase subunit
LERRRNRASDVRLYRFEYVDRTWEKNPLLRQLVVRATNPEGRTVQVAVLTDDLERDAEEIIQLIFNRWLQENDFKYLDKHFGINQLTSYRSIKYEELKGQINDRQVQSQAWRDLAQSGKEIQRQQARVLLVQERAQRSENLRQEKIRTLQEQMQQPGTEETSVKTLSAELVRIKTASRRYETYRQQRQSKLDELHEKLKENQMKKEAVEQEVSRVDQLIEQDMVRMDTGAKRLMDAIKVTARNLFYRALAPFKEAYDNYRDDHDYFRQLTLTAGVLRWTGQEIEVHLVPHLNYSPQLTNIIQKLMASLNERKLTLPDGSQRPLRFRLTRKEEIAVRLQIGSDPA